jgi:hypothetical protein
VLRQRKRSLFQTFFSEAVDGLQDQGATAKDNLVESYCSKVFVGHKMPRLFKGR